MSGNDLRGPISVIHSNWGGPAIGSGPSAVSWDFRILKMRSALGVSDL